MGADDSEETERWGLTPRGSPASQTLRATRPGRPEREGVHRGRGAKHNPVSCQEAGLTADENEI